MRETETQNQNDVVRPSAKKSMSDGALKIVCLLIFLGVAVGGIALNLHKANGNATLFGYSLPKFGGGTSKEEQRRAIMQSDMNDAMKARKLLQLAKQD